jgi:ribosomal protein L24
MSNYVPPHRRKDDTNEVEQSDSELVESSVIGNMVVGTSFADITENGSVEEVYNYTDNIRPGWSVIKRNTPKNRSDNCECSVKTSNVMIFESHQTKKFKEINKNKAVLDTNSLTLFDNMLNNWDNFRDIENDLQGDLSVYHNYKDELAKMRVENEYIDNAIDEYARLLELTDSESDDDDRYS